MPAAEESSLLRVTDVQRFSAHDGPGIRTVVFLKGCPLRCAWCHNPETQRAEPEIRFVAARCIGCGACAATCPRGAHRCSPERVFDRSKCIACGACAATCPAGALERVGEERSVAELLGLVRRDAPFYGREGGLTLSGGEPMAQPEGALALLAAAREAGIGTCVETCGAFDPAFAPRLASLADTVLFDLKDTDAARLRENAGGDLDAILRALRALDAAGANLALRCVLVPSVNLLESHARAVADVFRSLRHARHVELLPYHSWGVDKAVQTGRGQRVFKTPDPADVDAFARILRETGVPVKHDSATRPPAQPCPLSPRIRRLQGEALAHDVMPAPVPVEHDPADLALPEPVRIGTRLARFMDAQPVLLAPDQELLGWLPFDGSAEADVFTRRGHAHFWKLFREYYRKPQENLVIFEWQHSCADFAKIVREGFDGVRRDVASSRLRHAGDPGKLAFLDGCDLVLDAIGRRAARCAAAARAAAAEAADPARRDALLAAAARCEHVPMKPARSFAEGVQSVFFCFDFLPDGLGRPDQYLRPLYEADLASGAISRERAAELLQELWIGIHAHTPHASPNYDKGGECHFVVGGLAPDGSDAWNDLSRLVVESILACDLKRPQISLRWHAGTSREVLRLLLDAERRDPNKRIAFDGDEPRVRAFVRRAGLPAALARDYTMVGCNEAAFQGGLSVGGCHVNALRALVRLFAERRAEVLAAPDWPAFLALFEESFLRDLGAALDWSDRFNRLRARDCNVLSSLLVAGCVERAESATRGGASRTIACLDLLGTPNLFDSLAVVRQFVYDERRCTMAELLAALDADWRGHEALRARIRRDGRFFGNDDPFPDGIARAVHAMAARFADARRDLLGRPVFFGNHTGYNDNFAAFGALTPATPDGRAAGDPLAFGSGAANGRDRAGPTATLLSAAHMDPTGAMCGTSILNLSLDESLVRDDGTFEKLVTLVEAYFREGGLHLQLNRVSREELLDAKAHPERHGSLRVRVSGFSAFFTTLSGTIQDDVIARTVHLAR